MELSGLKALKSYLGNDFRDFKLTTLFYETVPDAKKYTTVAVTKRGSKFQNIKDLQGAKACFPIYDGIAWNSVAHILQKWNLIGNY